MSVGAPSVRRPDLLVVARLLESLQRDGNRMRKTRLQMAAGINYTIFSRYLDLLRARGLVELVADGASEGEWVQLTPKGYEALRFLLAGIHRVIGPPDPRQEEPL